MERHLDDPDLWTPRSQEAFATWPHVRLPSEDASDSLTSLSPIVGPCLGFDEVSLPRSAGKRPKSGAIAQDFVKLLLVEDVPCTAALALQHPWRFDTEVTVSMAHVP